MGAGYNFNPTEHNPNFGGGGDSLPVGKHPVIGSKAELKNAQSNNGNGYLALTVTAIDGPAKGGSKTIRFNLHNSSEVAARIARDQLAATCLVMGQGAFSDIDALLGKPFVIDVAPDPQNPDRYTEVVGVYALDGRSVAECLKNPPKAGGNAPNMGGGNGGQQNNSNGGGNSGGGWGANGSQGAGSGAADNGGGQSSGSGGWSMASGADTGNGGGQATQTGNGGGWGGNGGGASTGNGGGGGGWSQSSGGGSTGGGWGQSA